MKNFNLLSLPYPMFETTEEEKQLLRKAEIKYASNIYFLIGDDWRGLCDCIPNTLSVSGSLLREKVRNSLGSYIFLHSLLLDSNKKFETSYLGLNVNNRYKLLVTLRKIWISKLLNYKPEVK